MTNVLDAHRRAYELLVDEHWGKDPKHLQAGLDLLATYPAAFAEAYGPDAPSGSRDQSGSSATCSESIQLQTRRLMIVHAPASARTAKCVPSSDDTASKVGSAPSWVARRIDGGHGRPRRVPWAPDSPAGAPTRRHVRASVLEALDALLVIGDGVGDLAHEAENLGDLLDVARHPPQGVLHGIHVALEVVHTAFKGIDPCGQDLSGLTDVGADLLENLDGHVAHEIIPPRPLIGHATVVRSGDALNSSSPAES
jgi:hypothetical protein